MRDRLRWLMLAGAGLRAMVAATLAHSVAMTANMGQQGQAAGGTAAGRSRAPEEEVLVPFPRHVLVRIGGRRRVVGWFLCEEGVVCGMV